VTEKVANAIQGAYEKAKEINEEHKASERTML